MARIKISLPEQFNFSTKIPVRIQDVNYGGHVGNDAILSIMHEARMKYLKHFGYSEMDFGGTSMIMADSAIEYKGESFYGDELQVYVQANDFHKVGFDLVYMIINQNEQPVANAKTGMLCFDYKARKLVRMPEEVQNKIK